MESHMNVIVLPVGSAADADDAPALAGANTPVSRLHFPMIYAISEKDLPEELPRQVVICVFGMQKSVTPCPFFNAVIVTPISSTTTC